MGYSASCIMEWAVLFICTSLLIFDQKWEVYTSTVTSAPPDTSNSYHKNETGKILSLNPILLPRTVGQMMRRTQNLSGEPTGYATCENCGLAPLTLASFDSHLVWVRGYSPDLDLTWLVIMGHIDPSHPVERCILGRSVDPPWTTSRGTFWNVIMVWVYACCCFFSLAFYHHNSIQRPGLNGHLHAIQSSRNDFVDFLAIISWHRIE